MSKMKVLLKKCVLRILCVFLWAVFSAWLFVLMEYTEKDGAREKYQLLISLYKFMATKYNMSLEDFNNFSRMAHEALTEPKLEWTFFQAMDFVFQAFTTVGELTCRISLFVGRRINVDSAGTLLGNWVKINEYNGS